jgi:hypothetical protein
MWAVWPLLDCVETNRPIFVIDKPFQPKLQQQQQQKVISVCLPQKFEQSKMGKWKKNYVLFSSYQNHGKRQKRESQKEER